MSSSLADLFGEAVDRHADQNALAYGERVLSYRELDAEVDRVAGAVQNAVRGAALEGDRIAVLAPNGPLLVAATLAAWRLGAVAVPLNARLREHELSQILADAQPRAVVAVREHLGFSFTELLPRLLAGVPTVRACLFGDADGELADCVPLHGADSSLLERLGSDVAAILYTSGTTGTPKGALVTDERESVGSRELAAVLELGPADAVGFVIPISHAFGLTCLLSAFTAGAEAVLVESTTTQAPLLAAAERRGISVLHGSPALFASLLKTRPGALPRLRAGFVGGAPAASELLARLDEHGVLNLYGLTEVGAVTCCRPSDPPERRRAGAARPVAGVEVRLHGAELQVRGPFAGYYRRRAETDSALDDGWFRTGDVAEIDDGYVRISGRLKELVHVGGFNVFPAEVEAVLLAHPDVVQAVVVGAPDDRMGEVLRAFVVARPGSELAPGRLLHFARGRIAGYKLPYSIRIVSELPLLPSGKPDRRALAAG